MLKGTEVLWPEHENYLELQKEIVSDGIRVFMKEKQNEPMSDEENLFDASRIKYYIDHGDYLEICGSKVQIPKVMLECYGAIDPATGQEKARRGKKGSFTSILIGYKDHLGRVFVNYDYTKRVAPSVFIEEMFHMHQICEFKQFGVEENLFKNLLSDNIRKEQAEINRKLSPKDHVKLPIFRINQVENKEKRIYTLEPKVNYGQILFEKNNLSQTFWDQVFNFPKGDQCDALDALEMLYSLANKGYNIHGVKINKVT